ncbi:vacuolar ATPase assembly integral membrane protein vma21 [Coemansia spiralis]|uniref:Vacuolar ATPase assembly integral membrane protein vma21 n=1 Tax=Coemansia spiralis TaxID=417178 RepID=A0A9W8L2H2_9FUNG|nr:vacuolar ATPase assembly integral membrane protein vma21 [Coemansia spiralis]
MPRTKAKPTAAATTAHASAANKATATSKGRGNRTHRLPGAPDSAEASSQEEEEDVQPANTPQIPGNVIRKLLAFSLLLLVLPILAYFGSLKYLFVGSTASSAIVAVIVANFVLAAYVYAAWVEDASEHAAHPSSTGKLKRR